MENTLPKTAPAKLTRKAHDHLWTLVLRWSFDLGHPISIQGALSDLVLSIPPDAPYPTPQNGNGSK